MATWNAIPFLPTIFYFPNVVDRYQAIKYKLPNLVSYPFPFPSPFPLLPYPTPSTGLGQTAH